MPYQLDHIDPTKTVMIVVDMQNDFVADGAKLRSAAAAAMVPKLASTLSFCRENSASSISLSETGVCADLQRNGPSGISAMSRPRLLQRRARRYQECP